MERMLSGIKPTGKLTLGNYIGAIQNFIKYQDEYELYVFIANLHAITVPQDKAELKKQSDKYDLLLSGGDQIWNLELTGEDYSYYLDFADNVRKASYGSSFGKNNFSNEIVFFMIKCN
jgi:hypothetical protein